ncbi:superoxide dismutase family protein [Frankia sp. AgB1.9]|uniref:superoxide dismutase family protein n=1 Tax=unclassified Frankia TaxID=2632575 RepID=UPI0019331ACE|nr:MULTISPECIES: superoxide dismutase family protein [unclassified Frankia]MBL7489300.1 superoxide dismutase family protein [Frankia sp. AgW1.1]MBL7548491.1 superoxide dismutase family protein [Frankia sp. AgB1.9]MBL7618010.1 superoxide dismutase family protein [Frankia sp. AgB1.8]
MRYSRLSAVTTGMIIALVPLALAGCGSTTDPSASAATPSASASTSSTPSPPPVLTVPPTVVLTRFARYSQDAKAITYDPARVPVDADVAVVSAQAAGHTVTVLAVRGLPPNQHFGAHVHQNACGQSPEDAGSHYQHQVDPKQPSVDPAYANSQNEIWLDFTTDSTGSAHSDSTVNWVFDARPHKSIIIHAMPTDTAPGHAGQAGDRLACVDL